MTQPLQEFASAARAFCSWCDSEPGEAAAEARIAFDHLATLVHRIVKLDAGDGGDNEETPDIPTEAYARIVERFRGLPFDFYALPFDPLKLDAPKEPEMGHLQDDLSDIWGDLERGLIMFDRGDSRGAAFEWRFGYQIHWGRHATAALFALHCWLVDY